MTFKSFSKEKFSKLFLEENIANPNKQTWQLFGIGMLRTTALNGVFFHVFDDRYKTPHVTEIHDHQWNLYSQVIAGEVRQRRYLMPSLTRAGVIGGKHIRRRLDRTNTESLEFLVEGPEEVYRQGDTYSLMAEEIHRSYPLPGTVTVCAPMVRETPYSTSAYRLLGEPYVPISSRVPTSAEVVEILMNAKDRWFS